MFYNFCVMDVKGVNELKLLVNQLCRIEYFLIEIKIRRWKYKFLFRFFYCTGFQRSLWHFSSIFPGFLMNLSFFLTDAGFFLPLGWSWDLLFLNKSMSVTTGFVIENFFHSIFMNIVNIAGLNKLYFAGISVRVLRLINTSAGDAFISFRGVFRY